MCDEPIFIAAFGAFFALATPAADGELPLDCRLQPNAGEMYMNTILEYRRAAQAGNRAAQEMLGLMYLYGSQLYGEGVAKDMAEAEYWLERAAAQDSVLARQLLRRYVLAETNRGIKRQPQRAA
jgi:TPR repeat protein